MRPATATAATSPLRQERVRQSLSIDELARRSGIERSVLGRYERGYARLRPEQLRRVARILRVPVRQISEPASR